MGVERKSPVNDRQEKILQSAMKLVMTYGFKRVTMDDIARDLGISRPALYQFFKNKTDIYRAFVSSMAAQALTDMENALAEEGKLQDRIVKALQTGFLDNLEKMQQTPHGAELLDMKNELSDDILWQFMDDVGKLLSKAYAGSISTGTVSPHTMAEQLVFYLEGLKAGISDYDQRCRKIRQFVAMQLAALEAEENQD